MNATTRSLSLGANATGALTIGVLAQELELRWAIGTFAVLGLFVSALSARRAVLLSVKQLPTVAS